MPLMGFGTYGIKSVEPIETAIVEVGYRHLDTASLYANETEVGQAAANAIAKGAVKREDLFITSKLWHTDYKDPEGALKQSLAKLNMPYVDMYLIHWPFNYLGGEYKVPMHQLWPQMEALVEKGLAKAIGVSNFNLQLLADMLTYCKIKPACNQIQIYPCHAQGELISFLKEQNIAPVAYCPIGRVNWEKLDVNLVEDDLIKELAQTYQRTPVQILLNWNLCRDVVVIPKAASKVHQQENFGAKDFKMIQADVDRITKKFDKGTILIKIPSIMEKDLNMFA